MPTSAPVEFGLPPMQKFLPADYQAHRQNWAFAQTANGVMYIGNSAGVLEYDGVRWRLIAIPNNALVRALALDPTTDRVYVGALDEIGYLEPDTNGVMQYQSLLPQLPAEQRSFSNVWHCHVNKHGVYFTTSGRLFRFGPDGVKSWPSQHQFVHSTVVGERFFLRDEQVGLLEQTDDELRLVPGGEMFSEHRISVLLEWPGKGDLLAISRTLGFMRYDGQGFTNWPTEIDTELQSKLIVSATPLADGRLAVGMLKDGLFILNSAGRLVGQLNRQTGLPDNSIYKLFQDQQQGLWLGTDNGIARLQLGLGFSRFNLAQGLDGNVYAMQRFNGQLYVGTAQGLYRLQPGPLPVFSAVPGFHGAVFALQPYQNQLIVGHYNGVYRLGPVGAELLHKFDSANGLLLVPGAEPMLLVAELNGISRLKPEGEHWRFVGRIPDVHDNATLMQLDRQGVVWLKLRGQDVLVKLEAQNGDWAKGAVNVSRMDIGKQLAGLPLFWLTLLQGQMRIIHQQQLYQLDESSGKLSIDPRFRQLFASEANQMVAYQIQAIGDTPDGHWLLAQHPVSNSWVMGKTSLQNDGSYRWQAKEDSGANAYSNWYREDDGRIWLGGTELYQWDPTATPAPAGAFSLVLRQVIAAEGLLPLRQAFVQEQPFALRYPQNKLRFEFAATSFQGPSEYAVWLEGVDAGWSEWSPAAFASYNSLWEGDYVLKVKARNGAGFEAQLAPFALQISPPWFRTIWAYAVYALLFLLLLNRWYHWRSSRLRAEAILLNQLVDQRTADLSKAKTEVEQTLTSLKSTQRQLVRAEKMAALGQLVAGVAHEVNTPLGVALTGSSFLRESTEILAGQLGSGQLRKQELDNFLCSALESSQLIERNLQRAADLISNFKQVSVDRSSGERRQFNLRGFLLEVEQSLATLWRNRSVQFIIDCPADIQLDTYPGALSQVITILAQNSLLHGFATDGGGEMRLYVRQTELEQLEIIFADNGAGIATAHLEKVFEPFFTTKRAHGGTGLGLHILFNLVTARLGGTVTVESQPGAGCRFILLLPLIAPAPETTTAADAAVDLGH
ncbi:ATP-binding protein [Rheinheimera texasensis]|uniref:ATP-binding protein n=1 Tax=Rheinheimera texasensis TaxID=306205 RepID=UPI0032B1ABFA